MAVFEYTAIDSFGKKRKGIVNADSPGIAGQKLRSQGLFPTLLDEVRSARETRKSSVKLFTRRVNQVDMVSTIRQLSTLLSAGLPLIQAISGVLEQMRESPLKKILAQIRERVNEGMSLAAAMDEHPQHFSKAFTAMIKAGESSGTLELVLERLADFSEQQLALKRKIQSTLAYPGLMLVVGISVIIFLMSYVIPKVTQIFLDLQQALPLPTILLIETSNLFRNFWLVFLIVAVVLFFVLRRHYRTKSGKALYDRLVLRVPLVGDLIRKLAISRFARTLGTLLANDVPLLTALDIVKNVVSNDLLTTQVEEIRTQVSEGQSMVSPMSRGSFFTGLVVQMVSAGEQSGQLPEMLLKVGEIYENDVSTKLTTITSLMEPVMILFLGGMVGFVVLAVLLPIFEMSSLVR
ncbi:MAG: type II secretion system inner membrane protein GspF [Desulfovibrionales bacterium]